MVIFRGVRYVSNVANFELIDINNIFNCLGGLINESTYAQRRGYLEKVRNRTRGRGPKIDEIERTYFLNGPKVLSIYGSSITCRQIVI